MGFRDTYRESVAKSNEQNRQKQERKALKKSPDGPWVFMTLVLKKDAELYMNRGWDLVTFTPQSYGAPNTWHLRYDRQALTDRLDNPAE